MNASSLRSLGRLVFFIRISFLGLAKQIFSAEVFSAHQEVKLVSFIGFLPRPHFLHKSEQFQLIMGLEYQLLDSSIVDDLLNLPHVFVLINNLHPVLCHFKRVLLVGIRVRQLFVLLQGQIVQLHQLQSRERLHIQESQSC